MEDELDLLCRDVQRRRYPARFPSGARHALQTGRSAEVHWTVRFDRAPPPRPASPSPTASTKGGQLRGDEDGQQSKEFGQELDQEYANGDAQEGGVSPTQEEQQHQIVASSYYYER